MAAITENKLDTADGRHDVSQRKAILRKQKGWKGFVHGYPVRRRIFDKIWPKIKWGKDGEESGAKEIERDEGTGKTIYRY